MGNYRIKIELISDLCVSDGGIYNSSIDTDLCYDKYGFPFIPAKRIKGCLREAAIELADWGVEVDENGLFGDKDDLRGSVRVYNAFLSDYDKAIEEIKKNEGHPFYHAQNILKKYTYIRTQTSIDYESGVASDSSLRTMRVVKRGNIFYANVECTEEDKKQLEKCCLALRHIGMARTRGLGEVRCSIDGPINSGNTDTERKVIYNEGDNKIWYSIRLNEPVIVKSISGGEQKTLDYIEGSKVIGIIAERMKKRGNSDFRDILDSKDIQFSNAYIMEGDDRLLETPGNYYSIKNDSVEFVDKLYETDESRCKTAEKQLSSMKHMYVKMNSNGELITKSVETENRYHHRRPEDKSIGRASDTKDNSSDSTFYQMSSIVYGQTFGGYVYGSGDVIKKVYDVLSKEGKTLLGYSRSSEYGSTNIRVDSTECVEPKIYCEVSRFSIKLEAPAIVYDKNATYSVSPYTLLEEVLDTLGVARENVDTDRTTFYLKNIDIGGYNVTWHARKPIITAFDKGTVVDIVLNEPIDITVPANFTIGERTIEGYGEATFVEYSDNGAYICKYYKDTHNSADDLSVNVQDNLLARTIGEELISDYIQMYSNRIAETFKVSDNLKAVLSNMVIMTNECSSFEEVVKVVNNRYGKSSESKKDKRETATKILKTVESKISPCIEEFQERYKVTGYLDDEKMLEDYQFKLLSYLIIALKYKARKGE